MPRSRTIHKWKKGTTGEGLFHKGKFCYVLLASILARSDGLSLKTLMMNLFRINTQLFCFTRHELMDWSCVDYLWIL